MAEFTLYTGYRQVSSWSLRGWLPMRKAGVPFDDVLIRYRLAADKQRLVAVSPTGRVPLLVHERDGERIVVWESLAIGEYLAETLPQRKLWPADPAARALARAVATEMHSGFRPLRDFYGMDLLARHERGAPPADVAADLARVQSIWRECRSRYGEVAGGPFLFGHFTIADAMYAPVATRFRTYGVALDPVSQAYVDAILADPDMQAWEEQARSGPPLDPPTP